MKNIMLNYYKHIAMPACLALVFGMPLAVSAQGATPPAEDPAAQENQPPRGNADAPSEQMGDPAGQTEVDDATKEKFVGAYIEIKDIQQEYTQKLEQVDDENQARDLQKQAQAEMVEVVESNGMTVHEYNQVVGAISSDPELRMEIEEMAQAQQQQ